MLTFVYLRSSRLHFSAFSAWLMHCQQGGKFEHVLAFWMHLEGFQVVLSHYWDMLCPGLTSLGHRFDQSDVGHQSDRCCWPVWQVKARLRQLLYLVKRFACIRLGGVALVQGELACVQVELFVVFELWFGGLCSMLELFFVSVVSSRYPCLRGLSLVFFKWSCSSPVLWLLIACWSFF
jgi:hypothetical protein